MDLFTETGGLIQREQGNNTGRGVVVANPTTQATRPRKRGVPDPRDLRRRTEAGKLAALRCIERSALLPEPDRALIVAVYRDGASVKRLASLSDFGGDEAFRARSLRRRLRDVSARVLSPKYEFVARHLDPGDQSERRRLGLPCWPARRRAVATEVVIKGLSLRKAAEALGMTHHAVRREVQALNALFETGELPSRGAEP